MLPQQVMKVLLKIVQTVKDDECVDQYKPCESKGLVPSLKAIIHGGHEQCARVNTNDLCGLLTLLLAFRPPSGYRMLVIVVNLIRDGVMSGKTMPESRNKALVAMAKASRAYFQF
jgi:hypothetical protein